MATFTDAAWSTPESDLTPEQYCSVCLVDLNGKGKKIKANCHLPVRRKPGGSVYRGAVRNAMARLSGTKIPADAKRKAARSLVSLARQAGIEVTSQYVLRLAGKKAK